MDEPWTIAELAERAAGALTAAPPSVRSRRIREAPNERLIRWYATVGLVDPPLSRRGRVALYGRRHLLQLVAIKRRQADGRSLAEIQVELAGAADKQLEAIAQVAADPSGDPSSPAQGGVTGPGGMDVRPPARFWTRPAAEPSAETGPPPEPAGWPDGHPADQPLGLRVAPGVILLIEDAVRNLCPGDLAAVRQAARPLLSALARLGLTSPAPVVFHAPAAAKRSAGPEAAERKPT
jgi:DNA-binding transcriptional MerR regulator